MAKTAYSNHQNILFQVLVRLAVDYAYHRELNPGVAIATIPLRFDDKQKYVDFLNKGKKMHISPEYFIKLLTPKDGKFRVIGKDVLDELVVFVSKKMQVQPVNWDSWLAMYNDEVFYETLQQDRFQVNVEHQEINGKLYSETLEQAKTLLSRKLNNQKEVHLTEVQLMVLTSYQNRMFEIQRHWTSNVNGKDWEPTPEEERYIELYWFLVYDEWINCTYFHQAMSGLWNHFIIVRVVSAFQRKPFMRVLKKLIDGQTDFAGYKDKFIGELRKWGADL